MPDPIYAIGDIHGQTDELFRVLKLIEADGGPDARIVFVGDYVDRGPDSRGVVQFLLDAEAVGKPWVMLKGNHDRYFTRFYENGSVFDPATRPDLFWLNARLGGDKTLLSYGVIGVDGAPLDPIHAATVETVPAEHIAFLNARPLMHVTDDLVFVHAGLRPKVPLDKQVEDDLLWIRKGFIDNKANHGRLVVHGHTALEFPARYRNRINLDGGAGYFRPLYAAVFEGRKNWLLTEKGRIDIPKG
ncbi:MAG: metallophosphoesterase family protein [Sulfitobacter sp.]